MGLFNKKKIQVFKPKPRRNIGVVGLGMIGGSIAKALVANMDGANLVGVDPRADVLDCCIKDHIINFGHADFSILRGCEAVFVCTPIETVPDVIAKVYSAVGDSAVISDVAGVKRQVFAGLPHGIRFVSGHPMAGSEKQGFENSDAALMEKCTYILIREINTLKADFDLIKGIISSFTDNIIETDAGGHDSAAAAASHLPHIIAYTLAKTVLSDECAASVIAGGFKDITRIAQTETALWVNTCRLNEKAVTARIDEYAAQLASVRGMIEKKQWDALKAYFNEARELRLAINKTDGAEKGKGK